MDVFLITMHLFGGMPSAFDTTSVVCHVNLYLKSPLSWTTQSEEKLQCKGHGKHCSWSMAFPDSI